MKKYISEKNIEKRLLTAAAFIIILIVIIGTCLSCGVATYTHEPRMLTIDDCLRYEMAFGYPLQDEDALIVDTCTVDKIYVHKEYKGQATEVYTIKNVFGYYYEPGHILPLKNEFASK